MIVRGAGFEIYQRDDGKWDWRLVAGNEEIVSTSGGQGFRDRTDAERGIRDTAGVMIDAITLGLVSEQFEAAGIRLVIEPRIFTEEESGGGE